MSDEKARSREGEDIQGELEGLVPGDPAPGDPPPESGGGDRPVEDADPETAGSAIEREAEPSTGEEVDAAGSAGAGSGERTAPDEASGEDAERLTRSLEILEERVTLLLERHAELLRSHREAVEELDRKSARLEGLRSSGEDPERLLERIRSLEAENDRLSEHAAFLEGRIESLLNRVRYVVES